MLVLSLWALTCWLEHSAQSRIVPQAQPIDCRSLAQFFLTQAMLLFHQAVFLLGWTYLPSCSSWLCFSSVPLFPPTLPWLPPPLSSLMLEHSAPQGWSPACSCSFLFSPWPWWPPPLLHPPRQTNPPPAVDYPWSLWCQHPWRAGPCETWCGKCRKRGSCCAAASRRCCFACRHFCSSHPHSHAAPSGTVGEPHERQAPSVTPTSWICTGGWGGDYWIIIMRNRVTSNNMHLKHPWGYPRYLDLLSFLQNIDGYKEM